MGRSCLERPLRSTVVRARRSPWRSGRRPPRSVPGRGLFSGTGGARPCRTGPRPTLPVFVAHDLEAQLFVVRESSAHVGDREARAEARGPVLTINSGL